VDNALGRLVTALKAKGDALLKDMLSAQVRRTVVPKQFSYHRKPTSLELDCHKQSFGYLVSCRRRYLRHRLHKTKTKYMQNIVMDLIGRATVDHLGQPAKAW
jgi:hypothetical protein